MTELDIKTILNEYPAKIEEAEKNLFKLKIAQTEREFEQKEKELFITQEVERDAKTDAFKEALSNATKRNLEVKSRLSSYHEYQLLLDNIDAERKNIAMNEIVVNRMKREYRSAESLARLE